MKYKIKTKFRNISLEEIGHPIFNKHLWEQNRNQPVEIYAPAIEADRQYCNQLQYQFVLNPLQSVCSHMVEIGD